MFTSKITLSLSLLLAAALASVSVAAVPNDAGFKARGMRNAWSGSTGARYYSAPSYNAAPSRSYSSYSYQPSAVSTPAVGQSPCGGVAAVPAPAASGQVRSYSYQPAPAAPVYRSYGPSFRSTSPSHWYGGGYPSKANLKY